MESDIEICNQKSYTVYKHTTPSGKVYIGITRQRPETRWNNGKRYLGNPYFSTAIKKYGWANIQHDIIHTGMTKEAAEREEIHLIALLNSTDRMHGYNIEHGGKTLGTIAEETKNKLRELNTGKEHTEESKRKVSDARLGVKKSEETRQRMKAAAALRNKSPEIRAKISAAKKGVPRSPEAVLKMRQISTGRKHKKETIQKMSRPVLQCDLSGNHLKTWLGIREAGRVLNIDNCNIGKCCKGIYKSAGGFVWRYAE